MRKVLIVGATSAIAEAVARRFAEAGDRLYLTARDPERLETIARDLRVRGAPRVEAQVLEATDYDRHPEVVAAAAEALDGLDTALIAHGLLPDQEAAERSFDAAREALEVNLLSVVSLLTHLGNAFAEQGRGTIAVIGSVAGDRGRASNYVYGSAKGALALFAEGLRHRLHPRGVRVVTLKPGFVDTPMTADLPKGGPLWASPGRVADGIVRAMERGRPVAYLPWFWLGIMTVIRLIPEPLFRRLNL